MTTAYGSITVSGLTDIADIYFEYSLAVSSANVTNDYPFTQAGELGWTINGESRKTPPTWQSGYKIWVREVKIKTDVATKFYGNPYPDTAINQTNVDLEALQTKVKKMWSNSTGSYMASGIGNNDVDTATVSTYGFNSRTTTGGISFNYNAIPLTELGTSGLKLYIPTISNNTVTSSNLGVELTTSALKFYDPTYHKAAMVLTGSSLTFNKPNTTTAAAVLNSNGLVLSSGGIKAGTFNNQSSSNRFIYLSTGDYGSSITINGHSASNWRAIIGTKFGVDNEGNLYASNANISGAIVATSLSLGSGVTIPASTGVSGLSTVATTGSYNDLSDTPTIPSLTGYIYQDGTVGNTPAEGATGFVVSSAGLLQASNAVIYGSLYASKGYIGGWQIGTDGNKSLHNGSANTSPTIGNNTIILSKGLTSSTTIAGSTGSQTWTIAAGRTFGVTTAGKLYATGVSITGVINAETGTFGNATNKITVGTGTSGHSAIRYGMTTLADTTNNGFYIGTDGLALGKGVFKVTSAGVLIATSANITGAITASSLTIQEQATIVDNDGLIDNGALPIEDLESSIKTATDSSNDNLKYLMSIYVEDYTSNMIDPTDPEGQAILPLPKLNGEIDERKESSLINRNLVLINDNGISIRGTSAEQTTSLNITSTDMQFTTSSGTPILTIHAEEEETSYIDADMGQFEFVNMQNGECNLTWVARSNGHLTLKEV